MINPTLQHVTQHTCARSSRMLAVVPATGSAGSSFDHRLLQSFPLVRQKQWRHHLSVIGSSAPFKPQQAAMVKKRVLQPASVWDTALVEEAFVEAGIKPGHIQRLYRCALPARTDATQQWI